MILFDPGLAPRSSRDSAAKRKTVAASAKRVDSLLPSQVTLARFLSRAQKAVRLRGEVSVLLTTDTGIRRLNRLFRGIDRSTDVLSFPAPSLPSAAEPVAGDLAISVPTAQRQAAEHGHALSAEIKILMLHGLLHLAGYDHHADSGQMGRRERLLRNRLKLPQGLIERAGAISGARQQPSKKRNGASAGKPGKGRRP
jgi:probable rRNA maturation factor